MSTLLLSLDQRRILKEIRTRVAALMLVVLLIMATSCKMALPTPAPTLESTVSPMPVLVLGEPISPANAERVTQLARLAGGVLGQFTWATDGQMLAVANATGISIYEVTTLRKIRFIETKNEIESVAFSPDGKTLASGDLNTAMKLWQVATGRELRSFSGQPGATSVAFSPDGNFLAARTCNGIKLWKVATGRKLWEVEDVATSSNQLVSFLPPLCHTASNIAFSPDGKALAVGSDIGAITFWDVKTGHRLRTLSRSKSYIGGIAFSLDGKILAEGSQDRTITLWDMETERQLYILSEHEGGVRSVAFSWSGEILASGDDDYTVTLWDVATRRKLHTLPHRSPVLYVAFSPGDKILATGASGGTVRLWGVR